MLDAQCQIKLCDFGLAIDQKFEQANTRLGTFGYFAPEVGLGLCRATLLHCLWCGPSLATYLSAVSLHQVSVHSFSRDDCSYASTLLVNSLLDGICLLSRNEY